jgi:hypothetical protein
MEVRIEVLIKALFAIHPSCETRKALPSESRISHDCTTTPHP